MMQFRVLSTYTVFSFIFLLCRSHIDLDCLVRIHRRDPPLRHDNPLNTHTRRQSVFGAKSSRNSYLSRHLQIRGGSSIDNNIEENDAEGEDDTAGEGTESELPGEEQQDETTGPPDDDDDDDDRQVGFLSRLCTAPEKDRGGPRICHTSRSLTSAPFGRTRSRNRWRLHEKDQHSSAMSRMIGGIS